MEDTIRQGRVLEFRSESNAAGHLFDVVLIELDSPLATYDGFGEETGVIVAATERYSQQTFDDASRGLGAIVNVVVYRDVSAALRSDPAGRIGFYGFGSLRLVSARSGQDSDP